MLSTIAEAIRVRIMFERDLINKVAALTLLLTLYAMPAGAEDDDVQRALSAVRTRAMRGEVIAQHTLGSMLYYGASDLAQAIDWLRKAAAQDHGDAEFQLGQIYEFGFGVAPDDREALAWYRRASDHGSAAAQRMIGEHYRRGRGVQQDELEAVRWYQRAAVGDDLRAQVQLGEAYLNGAGIARDNQLAYLWFSVAASQTPLPDNQKALIEMRNIAAARMTPEQEATAERRAAEWVSPGLRR
jgi:TPR repeat protein